MSIAKQYEPLRVMQTVATPNGFTSPPRGWNSFGLHDNPAVSTNFSYDQMHVIEQYDTMAENFFSTGYQYCSLDSQWSVGDHGDEFGRIISNPDKFNMSSLAQHLHSKGLKLGVYVVPGAFSEDANKTILNTNIKIKETFSGNNDGLDRSDFDFSKPRVQEWQNSVIALFARW